MEVSLKLLNNQNDYSFDRGLLQPKFEFSDDSEELTLRPKTLASYVGQNEVKQNLKIYIEAARKRQEPLDHCLFYGPPGLGKTTLAMIVANELGVNMKTTSGPAIEKPGDLAAILSGLSENDVLFIDEIHRLTRHVEEILYPAMEDGVIDIVIGKGPSARSVRLELEKFTLIGATTKAGQLSTPLRDRFGVISHLKLYSFEELTEILIKSSKVLKINCSLNGASELAKRSRGTPRIANRLLKRCRDFAQIIGNGVVDLQIVRVTLNRLGIDEMGLSESDRRMLISIIETYGGGPVGLDSIAALLGEEAVTIEEFYEPFLMQLGFLNRTPRGRCVTEKVYDYLKIKKQ